VPDEILGIPLHPLLVHAAVVFIPLAALGTIVVTLVPRWRKLYLPMVVVASGLSALLVPFTTNSGENLKDALQVGGPVLEKVEDHQAMGERVIWAVVPMFVLNLATLLMARAGRPAREVTIVAWLATAAAVVATVLVVLTGHLGSQAVWDPTG
jgi:uncharacterized membrane protein